MANDGDRLERYDLRTVLSLEANMFQDVCMSLIGRCTITYLG